MAVITSIDQRLQVSDRELNEIAALIEKRSGILFDDTRSRFFSSRVREYFQTRRAHRCNDVLRAIRTSNVEYEALLERLLTQETGFFRYPQLFEALEQEVVPELHMKKFWENPRNMRMWCAACSTGEEPYSIAMTLAEALDYAEAWHIQVLATDISRKALQHAERGVYSRRALDKLSAKQIETNFAKVGDQFMVKPRLRNLVTFAQMNLVDTTYVGKFDVIFCMNVLVYFSEQKRRTAMQQLYDALEPGGYLFLGHADSTPSEGLKFQSVVHGDVLIYQKPITAGRFSCASVEEERV